MKLSLIIVLAGLSAFADPGEDLHAAARRGQLAEVKRLLEAGAPLEWKNSYGSTPLYMAVFNRHLEVAILLLDKGANPIVTDTFYKSSLIDGALQKDLKDVLLKIAEKGHKFSPQQLTRVQAHPSVLAVALKQAYVPGELADAMRAAAGAKNDASLALLRSAGAAEFKAPAVDPAVLNGYAGDFGSPAVPLGVKITAENGQLQVRADGQNAAPLTTDSATEFSFAPASLKLVFEGNDKFVLHQGGQKIDFFRKGSTAMPAVKKVEMALLNKYTGHFTSPDLPLEVDVFAADGVLSIQATKQPKLNMTAESDTVFTFAPAGAKMTFAADGTFTLEQGGRTAKYTKAK
ncbi:MAG: ankyrin repeat domain-containing protein [Acidobacteria bacterium]|nr:ankyrin repeat domain-containing protein [Acidobacteriota bacterium]